MASPKAPAEMPGLLFRPPHLANAFDLAQYGPRQPIHNFTMDAHLAVLVMVGIALTYVLSRMLWDRREG